MPATMSTMDPIFKEDYGPVLTSQLYNATPALDWFEKVSDIRWQGKYHVEPVHVNRNRGSYWSSEGGAQPTAGNQQIENLRIPCRFFHGAAQFTIQAIKASQSDKGAFNRIMRLEMDSLLKDMRISRNLAVWGDGRGIRAFLNGSVAATSEVDAPGGVAGATHGNRFLNIGDVVAFVTPATGALSDTGTSTITARNTDGTDITFSTAPTGPADNDYIVKAFGEDTTLLITDTDYQQAAMGIRGIVDDGSVVNDFFGLSRVTFPIMQSTVTSSAGALSADLLYRQIDSVGSISGGSVTKHVMAPDVRRAFLTIMENDRRYTMENLKAPDPGVKTAGDWLTTLSFGGKPIYVDHFAPFGEWYGLDTSSWRRASMTDGEWADETGAVLTEVTGAVDTYKALYRIYENYYALNPNTCFRISGITSNIVVAHTV